MGQINLIVALIFTLIIATFSVLNVEVVRVNFLFTQSQLPLIIVIIASTLTGGLIVGSVGLFRQFKLKQEIKGLKQQLEQKLEQEGKQDMLSELAELDQNGQQELEGNPSKQESTS